MKMKLFPVLLILCGNILLSASAQESAQNTIDSIIVKALKDELSRNLNELTDKESGKPFFINYTYLDGEITEASATLGTLFSSDKFKSSDWNIRLMMGNYNINDENFQDNYSNNNDNFADLKKVPPIEPDYLGIRNAFWWNTNNIFRSASRNYKSKLAALKDKPITSDEKLLPDYTQAAPVKIARQGSIIPASKRDLEILAKDISSVFKEYKDVYSSSASVYFYSATVYVVNTEGSELRLPLSVALVKVNASVYSAKGERLSNSLSFTASNLKEIAHVDTIKNAARILALHLINQQKAQILEETYNGPVLFFNDGVADVFSTCLFGNEDPLIADREQLVNSLSKSMTPKNNHNRESKLEKRIISKDITVRALPFLKEYKGIPLMGSFEVDAECIVPPNEILLISKGFLKSMLCDRVPSKNFKASNGHNRIALSYGGIGSNLGPGVIRIESENTKSHSELKQLIVEIAKNKGLEYVIFVKPLLNSKGIGPLCFYKFNISTGKEELMRDMSFSEVDLKTLNRIAGCGNGTFVQNLVFDGSNMENSTGKNGLPASFIVPDALLIEEMELTPEFPYSDTGLPLLDNPVSDAE